MRRALEAMVIEGIKTTVPLHRRIMEDDEFISGHYSTKFMQGFLERLKGEAKVAGA
jgi:acetyl-CoA carboxylase biotin carboxylase subunit